MNKAWFLLCLLTLIASCEKKDDEEDLSDLKSMVQLPKETESSTLPSSDQEPDSR